MLLLTALSRPADPSIIGGADAMTEIAVSSPVNARLIEAITGIAALAAAMMLMLRRLLKKHLSKGE